MRDVTRHRTGTSFPRDVRPDAFFHPWFGLRGADTEPERHQIEYPVARAERNHAGQTGDRPGGTERPGGRVPGQVDSGTSRRRPSPAE